MISSMTGYGKGAVRLGETGIQVEIRALNHRFCDISVKVPRNLVWLESAIKKKVCEELQRGKGDVFLTLENGAGGEATPHWNRALALQYIKIFTEMRDELHLEGGVPLELLAAQRDVVTMQTCEIDQTEMEKGVFEAVTKAVEEVKGMRRNEGKALCDDLRQRLETLSGILAQIERRAPAIPREWKDKLVDRLQRLDKELVCDPQRVAQEVALFADRCDISEEILRLKSHFSQFVDFLEQEDAVGRQLDFLVQEMGREINTIGSKGNDSEVSRWVVSAKGELEKIREQVQNVM